MSSTAVSIAGVLVIAACIAGCKRVDNLFCSGAGCEWTAEEWARVQTLAALCDPSGADPTRPCDATVMASDLPAGDPAYALAPKADLSNKYLALPNAATLGRLFYFDPNFSGKATLVDAINRPVPYARAALGSPVDISCATCHDPARAGADFTSVPDIVSIGAGWYDVNGQETVNVAFYDLFYWNGRSDSLWSQAAAVSESKFSMNGNRIHTLRVIAGTYASLYNGVFDEPLPSAEFLASLPANGKPGSKAGCQATDPTEPFEDAWDCQVATRTDGAAATVNRVLANFGKAIEAYEYQLTSLAAPFDRFVHEGASSQAISPAAKRGAQLFVGKASCIDCHSGPLLTDRQFHNIGVPQTGDHVPTLADCPVGGFCDCTTSGKEATCLPSGAWGGLFKLNATSNAFRRNGAYGDPIDPTNPTVKDESLAAYYCAPTDQSLKGSWRTPSLRNVAITAPYMHDGYYQTLEDVVWHYNSGGAASGSEIFPETDAGVGASPTDGSCAPSGSPAPIGRAAQIKPLDLTDDEVSDLVEFLKTLTGQPFHPELIKSPPPIDGGVDAGPSPAVDASASQ